MMTDVVPSPTSSSCVLLNSMIDCTRRRCKLINDTLTYAVQVETYLGSWVRHIYFSQYSIPIVGQNNSCNREPLHRAVWECNVLKHVCAASPAGRTAIGI